MITRGSLLLVSAAIIFSSTSSATEFLTNGGFEDSNFLQGWVPFSFDASTITSTPSIVSPFASPYGISTTATRLSDVVGNNESPELVQEFTAVSGKVRLSFDFNLQSFSDDFWYILPAQQSPDTTSYFLNFDIGRNGSFRLADNSGNLDLPIAIGSWYHVFVDFDFSTQKLSGALSEYNGGSIAWTNRAFLQTLVDLNSLTIRDANLTDAKNGDLIVDNFSVTETPNGSPVPEPSTYGLTAGIVAFGAILLRRNRKV